MSQSGRRFVDHTRCRHAANLSRGPTITTRVHVTSLHGITKKSNRVEDITSCSCSGTFRSGLSWNSALAIHVSQHRLMIALQSPSLRVDRLELLCRLCVHGWRHLRNRNSRLQVNERCTLLRKVRLRIVRLLALYQSFDSCWDDTSQPPTIKSSHDGRATQDTRINAATMTADNVESVHKAVNHT